jgi:AraC-like DNA-binding protein
MPLYMDCHDTPGIKIEEAEKAHLKDLAVQEKYGVKYISYWVNEESGKVFCLMKAPNKEAIHKTHLLANGIETCNIVEVEGGLYSAFMGKDLMDRDDLVVNENGTPDSGYRFILNLDIIAVTRLSDFIDFDELKLPRKPLEAAERFILNNNGNVVNQLSYDRVIAVFKTPESCLLCAKEIQEEFISHQFQYSSNEWNFRFTMGLCIGEPVSKTDDQIFQKALNQSLWYCKIAENGKIVLPIEFQEISVLCKTEMNEPGISVIDKSDQIFIQRLFDHINMNISNVDFTIDKLSKEMRLSRAQLYRKLNSMSNTSPVQFVRDVRLRFALNLIKERKLSISEIAYELGFSNPSYFAKCFKEKYGISPSKIKVEV